METFTFHEWIALKQAVEDAQAQALKYSAECSEFGADGSKAFWDDRVKTLANAAIKLNKLMENKSLAV